MSITFDTKKLLAALRSLNAALPADIDKAVAPEMSNREMTKLLGEVWSARDSLKSLAERLDPIRQPAFVLDPSDPKTTGMMIGKLLEELAPVEFDTLGQFYGSGVYAIYYNGDFLAYKAIRATLCPIYVGKADPSNPKAKTPKEQGAKVCGRLHEHAKSIRSAENLKLSDFICRYLVIQSGWQKAAEDYLIDTYQPVWNNEIGVCSGIGKHGDTARTERSDWDILHPGRPWAVGQTSRSGKTPEKVSAAIEAHYAKLCKAEPGRWLELLNQDWVKARFKR